MRLRTPDPNCIVLGSYRDAETGTSALRAIRRAGYHRAAGLVGLPGGRVRVIDDDVLPGQGALLGAVVALLTSAVYVGMNASPVPRTLEQLLVHLLMIGLGASVGLLAGRVLDFGLNNRLIASYRKWVLPQEMLIAVQAQVGRAATIATLMRRVERGQPAIFVIRAPRRLHPRVGAPARRERLPADRLRIHASELASRHRLAPNSGRTYPLWHRARDARLTIDAINADLSEGAGFGQSVSSAAEWLLDNGYIVQRHIGDVMDNLSRGFYEVLPVLEESEHGEQTRVHDLAIEFVAHTDSDVYERDLVDFLLAYQEVAPLTMAELWAVPLMLRLALVENLSNLAAQVRRRQAEHERADFWANRLLNAARRAPDQLLKLMVELAQEQSEAPPYFAERLISQLQGEPAALEPVRAWLERKWDRPVGEIIQEEQSRHVAVQVTIASTIGSLRRLSQLDWRETFETTSLVDRLLQTDPAAVYPSMDFDTRNQYRLAIEDVSRRSGVGELELARAALEAAQTAEESSRRHHVGYFLVGPGRTELESVARYRPTSIERIQRWLTGNAAAAYIGGIALLTFAAPTALLALAATLPGSPGQAGLVLAALLAILPASELAVQVVNYLVTLLLEPRPLPKLSFEKGIPADWRTLVVVPVLLQSPEGIRGDLDRLETRFLSNRDENLHYALLADFPDAPKQEMPADRQLLEEALGGMEELNKRYGKGRFSLFYRTRRWSESEQLWMGWERKRGKLEELNEWLVRGAVEEDSAAGTFHHVGEAAALRSVRFVIALDSDTQLPLGTARRMVGTLAHPLNRPSVPAPGGRVERGYGIIQPRVSTSLPSATATRFSRLFTDPTGVDPYTHVVSDVYQDLTGEASYHGKGIYDLEAFHQALHGRFPPETLLSHDLIEGAHVRVGLASDIELLDEFPSSYVAYTSRQHRWIRGDWQIADWVFPSVPSGTGGRAPNPLDAMNRWRILDNLRRSLVAPASVLLLLAGWLLLSETAWVWSLLVGLALAVPALLGSVTWIASQPPRALADLQGWRELAPVWGRALLTAVFLPHQAALSLDAITRALYRRRMSRRRLLEWQTSQMAQGVTRERSHRFVWRLGLVSLFAMALAAAVAPAPFALLAATPFLVAWASFPIVVAWLAGGRRRRVVEAISKPDRFMLRRVARQTWRYFDDFVGRESNWLPPDNYQESLRVEVAERTSPTNIGLWLVATVSAHDLGYLTIDQLVQRNKATLETLGRMERFEGHLLNWYNTRTLEPLYPRYVSTVDSGNLLASLWTITEGYAEVLSRPLIGPEALLGLGDTLSLAVVHPRAVSPLAGGADAGRVSYLGTLLSSLFADPPVRLDQLVERVRTAAGTAQELVQSLRVDSPLEHSGEDGTAAGGDSDRRRVSPAEDSLYWLGQVERQLARWIEVIERYLPWVERLAMAPQSYLDALGPDAAGWRASVLGKAPSLRDLAEGRFGPLSKFLAAVESGNDLPDEVRSWLTDLRDAASYGQWLAGEMLAAAGQVVALANDLSAGMDMSFIYDAERKLFSIGYNVSERRLDNSYYDLLASEARVASLIAIARAEVPSEHWTALGRPYGVAGGRRVLLSWSGTMFEYLMPLLFTRSFENSLLDAACRAAVAWQIEYARRRGIPWGMSEAAFAALDAHRIYQYQAFGVPGLGLKRGLEDDLVVAPYASALALMVEPGPALKNLKLLARLGAMGRYGYYDSIDFTRRRRAEDEAGVIVYTYMAHHQGMVLLSAHNALSDGPIVRRFQSNPRVRAVEPLLYERIPAAPPTVEGPTRGEAPPRLPAPSPVEIKRGFTTANSPAPRTHLLGREAYSVMVTNSGAGYSRWRDFDLTRWRADTTADSWGSFVYVKDVERGAVWSAAYHPTRRESSRYLVNYSSSTARFERRDLDLGTEMEIAVSLEDDAETRRVTLVNYSSEPREVDLTSYVELALAPHNADRAHPAFSKLFVQTEAHEELGALLAWRRPRSPADPPVYAVHVLATTPGQKTVLGFQYETDRARFIGRGRTLESPAALASELSNSSGSVLDPIFSLRHRVSLDPGQRVEVAFVTGAAESREAALRMAQKFRDLRAARRAFDMAESQGTLVARHLRVSPEDLQRYQQLAAHMLFPNPRFRAPASVLRRNRLGQSGLWGHGISGDLPIMLVTIGDLRDMPLVREALLAHTSWRLRGFKSDLVILDEEAAGYEQPLRDNLRRVIQAHTQYTGVDQPGGVFLRPAQQIPPDDLALLMTVARVVLVAARGSLAQQMTAAPEIARLPAPLAARPRMEDEPSSPLPFMELPYFNGFGGFTADGSEYAVYLGPGTVTPAPWVNVMANPAFGAMVSESGAGFAWYGNSQGMRLLPWSNDPVTDPAGDAVYIRDEQLGVYWTPTPQPVRENDAYRARHGQGYTVFEHNSHAIEQELVTFVPVDDAGGSPVRVQRLRLRNRSSKRRTLRVTYFAEWVLGGTREETQMHVSTSWDAEVWALMARNPYHPDIPGRVAFAGTSARPAGFTADRTEFLGRNGTMARPAAMGRQSLSGRHGVGFDPCAALQVQVELDPGREAEVIFTLGSAENASEARRLAARFRDPDRVEEALRQTRTWWSRLLGTIQVETPVLATNFMLNRWLLYQALSCRIWGRSAFYQSGGAIGFRDQLQDCLALVYSMPRATREQILKAAAHQFVEGDVQHWWHPESGAGVRTRISDDLLWLPFAVAHYVQVTGDLELLSEEVPFLDGRALEEHEHEAYFAPAVSMETGTVLEHCRRAISRASATGPHDLPLMGSGDWNDGMNRVGAEGKGESVWLAWFLIEVLNGFASLVERVGEAGEASRYRARARELAEAVERSGWDGEWYLRAYFDDGTPLGSRANQEAMIDSLSQSWGVISRAADPKRAETALASAERHLVRRDDQLALLFTPPFSSSNGTVAATPNPGYIAAYPPGVRENGGQYTHGALWLAMAFARQGDGDRAGHLLGMLNPVEHARTPEDVQRYKVEPYVVPADVYALEGHVGRGGWTWYTGSAGWMYRVWLEEVLGFKLRGDELTVDPVIPSDWDGFSIRYRYRSAEYQVRVENPDRVCRGVARVELDGQRVEGDSIGLRDDGAVHTVVVRLGGS